MMKTKRIGDCKLCGSVGVELKDGHIIPRHHIKSTGLLYDKSALKFESVNNKVKKTPLHKTYESDGWSDYMMCKDCDEIKIGSKLENYVADIIYNDAVRTKSQMTIKHYPNEKYGEMFEFGNIKYTEFKNYVLSMLWRASVTKHRDFTDLTLGSKYNEEFRDLILNNKWSPDTKFPIMIWTCHNANEVFISRFKKLKAPDGSGSMYVIVIGIFMYFIKVSDYCNLDALDETFEDNRLKESGKLPVMNVPKERWYNHINILTDEKLTT